MSRPAAVFVADPNCPAARAIHLGLPAGTLWTPCEGALPDPWPEAVREGCSLVLHRAWLGDADTDRLARDRKASLLRHVVLCTGPMVRYQQLERWAALGLADSLLAETTAAEVIARYLPGAQPPASRSGQPVAVLSRVHELGRMLADAVQAGGYEAILSRDWERVPRTGLVLWDVPVLEPSWAEILGRQAPRREVVALFGFPDQVVVARARSAGAAACLDLPCAPADLLYVLDRLAGAGSKSRQTAWSASGAGVYNTTARVADGRRVS